MEKAGMVNRYTCEGCGKSISTIIIDDGVTPAFLACKFDCESSFPEGPLMASAFYRVPQKIHPLDPNQYEWYRPKLLLGFPPAVKDHVKKGGLLLRKRFGLAHMFRGNCVCGKWLMIPPITTKENPLICECDREYYAERDGDDLTYHMVRDDEEDSLIVK